MKRSIAELITRDPEKFAHHDRVFKNNPVVMQGMGLAPLVVLATTGKNALMLAVAVALLLDQTFIHGKAPLTGRPDGAPPQPGRLRRTRHCPPPEYRHPPPHTGGRWSTLPLIPS